MTKRGEARGGGAKEKGTAPTIQARRLDQEQVDGTARTEVSRVRK